jgi:hypothetical protein
MTSPGPCSDGGLLRGGSDAPQGTNVDQTWVDVFNGRGRRSPLVSRPEGRPGEGAAAADFVDETVKTGDSVGCVRRDIAETGRCPLGVPLSNVRRHWAPETGGHDDPDQRGGATPPLGRHRHGVGARLPAAGGVAPPRSLTNPDARAVWKVRAQDARFH